jgi:primosomal protein N' (replication factor Y)
VEVGTIVRVPLHGRRVRGWTLARDVVPEAAPDRLRALLSVSSAGPPEDVVALTAFAAWRWAGPRATFLRAASAPNAVAPGPPPERHVALFPDRESSPITLPTGRVRVVVWPPALSRVDVVTALLEPAGSTVVVAPDPVESEELAAAARADGREVHILRGDAPAADRTAAWAAARHGACVAVGGRIAAVAPVPDLAGMVVLDDADESLAEERAPSWHARDLAAERCRAAGARLSFVSPAPTVEAVSLADESPVTPTAAEARRGWPRVEVVDLREEPPGAGLLSRALGPAIQRAVADGGRALLVVNRKGRARLLVCRTCGNTAECERCGARLAEGGAGLVCDRCGHVTTAQCRACGSTRFRKLRPGVTGLRDAVAALVPHRRVVAVDASSAPLPAFDVAVGTEAVLHRVRPGGDRPVRFVAFPELDQELLAPRYRAAEQALWLLVRAARHVGPADGGGTVLVQTRLPDHEVVRAARDADPAGVLAGEEARRRALGYPPFGGLAEISGAPAAVASACDVLRADAHRPAVTVLGPADGRALLRAPTVDALCDALAAADLTAARALGRLRVDVDPLRV